jgi:copper homeostasis protein
MPCPYEIPFKRMAGKYLIEAVVDSVEAAVAAEAAGADRLELCSGLEVGGLTPGAGLLAGVCAAVRIPVFVLLRPRGGDFLYTTEEFETILREAEAARDMGAKGVVAGMLLANGQIDVVRMKELIKVAAPLPVTFHRAFDRVADLAQAWEELLQTGCKRLLCSGLAASAAEGIETLKWLQERSNEDVVIMPGGGVTADNVQCIAAATGAREFHFSAIQRVNSKMQYHPAWMDADTAQTWVPAPEKVAQIKQILDEYFN